MFNLILLILIVITVLAIVVSAVLGKISQAIILGILLIVESFISVCYLLAEGINL